MAGLVSELQKDALDSNVKLSDLLRKALVVATKLKMPDFKTWIQKELNGYGDKIPKGQKMLFDHRSVGFYEWLFNPKYGVFEVFDVNLYNIFDVRKSKDFNTKSPEEIIKYLAGVKG